MIRFAALVALFVAGCQPGVPVAQPTPDPWPIPEPPLASAGASSCDSVIENMKRLGCPPEADDAGAWCATLTATQRTQISSDTNCLATRQHSEAAK